MIADGRYTLDVGLTGTLAILKFLWRATRGSRLRPWKSPYLLWRLETYSGVRASEIDINQFFRLIWHERHEMLRYLVWVAEANSDSNVGAEQR